MDPWRPRANIVNIITVIIPTTHTSRIDPPWGKLPFVQFFYFHIVSVLQVSIDYKYLTSCFVSQTDIINASPLPSRAIDQLQSKVGGTIIVSFHSLHPPHSDLSSVPIQEPPPLASIGPSEPWRLALASRRGGDGLMLRKARPPATIKTCPFVIFFDPSPSR